MNTRWAGCALRLAGWTAYSGLLLGCSPKEQTWQRPGLTYTARVDDHSVNDAVVDRLVFHRETIGKYLGLQGQDAPLRYRKFLDQADLRRRSHCSVVNAGCYFAQHGVESYRSLDAHELVHAYTAPLGDKPKLVEEGLAQALSCSGEPVAGVELAIEAGWAQASWNSTLLRDIDKLYRAGAVFVAYVIQVYGPERFMQFYASLDPRDEYAQAAPKFAAVLGTSLSEVWNAALANRSPDRACVYPIECAHPRIEGAATRVGELLNVGSGQMRSSHNQSPDIRTIVSDGSLMLKTAPTPNAPSSTLRLGGCDGTRVSEVAVDRTARGAITDVRSNIALGPGKYWLSAESVTVTARPLVEVLGRPEQCTSLQPLVVERGHTELLAVAGEALAQVGADAPTTNGGSWVYKIASDSTRGGGLAVECSGGVRVELCEACDYTRCQVACETGRSKPVQTVLSDATLRLSLTEERGFWVRLEW